MKQLALFEQERPIHRLSNGRFASRDMAFADKQKTDNVRLKMEVEKYRRMYLSVVKENLKLKEALYGKF